MGEIEVRQSLPPVEVVNRGVEQAKLLHDIVEKAGLAVDIAGRKYLRFEAWQTLGAFGGITPYVVETKEVRGRGGMILGYEARAEARQGGVAISSAEAMCTVDEENWKDKPLWQIRSMAQTRACAKALRNALAWIVVLAGYEPTPAEEMEVDEKRTRVNGQQEGKGSVGGRRGRMGRAARARRQESAGESVSEGDKEEEEKEGYVEGDIVDIVERWDKLSGISHYWVKVGKMIFHTTDRHYFAEAQRAKAEKLPVGIMWEKKGWIKEIKDFIVLEKAQ